MGCDLATWCATVKKYPLRYQYEGLSGFFTDVREAIKNDEYRMGLLFDAEVKSKLGCIDDFLEPHIDWMIRKLEVGTHDKELIDLCHDPDYSEELRAKLEDALGEAREEFCYWDTKWEEVHDFLDNSDVEPWLKKYPPQEVWSESHGCGIPVEDVIFICPSCGRQPLDKDQLNGAGYYCGLCGGEWFGPEDLTTIEGQASFSMQMDVDLYPYRSEDHIDTIIGYIDGEGNCWYAFGPSAWSQNIHEAMRNQNVTSVPRGFHMHSIRIPKETAREETTTTST